MAFKIDKASGGPYSHEIDLIRDERYRANVMGVKPDFEAAFNDVVISPGAVAVIEDIDKPIVLPQGEFVENVVFHDEEEASPEEAKAESEPEVDKGTQESNAQEIPAPEQRNPTVDETTPVSPEAPVAPSNEAPTQIPDAVPNPESAPAETPVNTEPTAVPAPVVALADMLAPVMSESDTPIFSQTEAEEANHVVAG